MRGYSENVDGDVVLTMGREDYERLLLLLGYAIGSMPERAMRRDAFALVNRIEAGNPNFAPLNEEPASPGREATKTSLPSSTPQPASK